LSQAGLGLDGLEVRLELFRRSAEILQIVADGLDAGQNLLERRLRLRSRFGDPTLDIGKAG